MSRTRQSPGAATRAPSAATINELIQATSVADAADITRRAGETVGQTWTAAYGLRRRREASYRLAPLDCGHRDPLDCGHRDPLDCDEVRIFGTCSIEAAEAAKAHLRLAGVA